MSEAVARVREALDARGVAAEITTFREPIPSAPTAAAQIGCDVGAIANSLVFTVGDEPILILASGAHRVDVGPVAARWGVGKKKVRRADPDTVLAVTGQRVGGVAPIGHPAPLTTLVDRWLERHEVVWASAGDDHSMFATTCSELVTLTDGTLLDIGD